MHFKNLFETLYTVCNSLNSGGVHKFNFGVCSKCDVILRRIQTKPSTFLFYQTQHILIKNALFFFFAQNKSLKNYQSTLADWNRRISKGVFKFFFRNDIGIISIIAKKVCFKKGSYFFSHSSRLPLGRKKRMGQLCVKIVPAVTLRNSTTWCPTL